ncbi:hypothetical protein GJ744_002601 [Endocarpon pusillum]|uniref:NADPH-dependent 1-acyldihydroxyacetone phosphate reductase n=1 Tax=Endocarpon pusillum TaxID=364733 RepID=A0A8H7AAJ4_9EURO|nr:hypothetical protein GJ744_002601 [Endocarpon pusillum]
MAQISVLITGCGEGGIGEALAREYQKRGCTVIVTVLPWESNTHLVSAGMTCFELDVTKEESVQALARNVQKVAGGKLHILVNNAGICYTMTGIDTDVQEVQKMFNVNVFGPMRMVREFHPFLISARGTIVNIGSVGGIVPYMYGSSYNATKAALHHWGNTLRVEMAPLGVKVITIISGNIGTNILKSDSARKLPEGSHYSPLAKEFEQHVRRVPATTPRDVYAARVVPQTLNSSPPAWYWVGATTGIVRFMDIFGFRTVWDYILWPVFNLGKLRKETELRRVNDKL